MYGSFLIGKCMNMKHIENRQILITSILCFLCFGFISCKKDWFDIKSKKNITVLSTLRDFEMLLDDYYTMTIGSPAIGEVSGDGYYTTEDAWATLSSDIASFNVQKNAYTWTKQYLNTEVSDWNMSYKVIFNCNLVLEGLVKIERTMENREQYDRIRGNALFHRGRAYFELSQVFTPPYNAESDSEFGLPFKESTDVSEKLQRSTIYQTYDKIEADFKVAAELLPDKAFPVSRGSKAACWGFLARIEMIRENYVEALMYVDKTLEIYNSLLDFNTISSDVPNLGLFNDEVIFHTQMITLQLTFYPGFSFIDSALFNKYEDNDLRKSVYFIVEPTGIIFKGMYNFQISQFAGLATDEMYLMKAEACARTNKISESMIALNDLLLHRYKKNSDGTTTLVKRIAFNEKEALEIIIEERRKELLKRGIRWMDLRRFNREQRFAVTLNRAIGGKIYTLLPNSEKYAFPIPDDEISFSNIPQNPGW